MSRAEYQPVLMKLMCFLDSEAYNEDVEFSRERLAEITPEDIARWMNLRVFGVEQPPQDANPIHYRSSSLAYWKKALSFFMPNKIMAWNEMTNQGNPTRSTEINELIKRVKKKEVRRQGKESTARRPMDSAEYCLTHQQFRLQESIIRKYGIPAFDAVQFSLISRVDDTSQLIVDHFKRHDRFPDKCLKTKLNWSKNVLEEREAPWQCLIGAMDPKYCVFLNVSLFLEAHLESMPGAVLSPYIFSFSNDNRIPHGGKKTKNFVQDAHRDLFRTNRYNQTRGRLGTHSLRKYASTYARNSGVSKDDKEVRGRWRSQRVSDVYDDMELPYVDMMVCGVLCVGGPCHYVLKANSGVTNQFIFQFVAPHIAQRFGNDVALVLGRALLWVTFSDLSEQVPLTLRTRIMIAYQAVPNRLPDGENPVQKRLLVITNYQDQVVLIEIDPDQEEQGDNVGVGNGGNEGPQSSHDFLRAMLSEMVGLRREQAELRTQRDEDRALLQQQHHTDQQQHRNIIAAISRLERQPIRMLGAVAAAAADNQQPPPVQHQQQPLPAHAQAPAAPEAALSPTPPSLHVLWEEWMTGVGGRKAARLFTPQE